MPDTPDPKRRLFYSMTEGIRVTATPFFIPQQSNPGVPRYVFGYRIRIENVGEQPAQLRWRHWFIRDPSGEDSEVEGEGVIGEEPLVEPGGVHEYQSFCILRGPEGHMEGYYEFERPDGSRFKVVIPRFHLRVTGL